MVAKVPKLPQWSIGLVFAILALTGVMLPETTAVTSDRTCIPYWGDEFPATEYIPPANWSMWEEDTWDGIIAHITEGLDSHSTSLAANPTGSYGFPYLWTNGHFPIGDMEIEIRFRYSSMEPYGTTIGVGTRYNDGSRCSWPDSSLLGKCSKLVGIEDVLHIHQVRNAHDRYLLVEVLGEHDSPAVRWEKDPDTNWHVVLMRITGRAYTLYVDGRYVGATTRSTRPKSIYLGNPVVHTDWRGQWTSLVVDAIRVRSCTPATPTPIPVTLFLERMYPYLIYYGPRLDPPRPAQILRGSYSGPLPLDGRVVWIEVTDGTGTVSRYPVVTDADGAFTLDATAAGDPDFGTTDTGTWVAVAHLTVNDVSYTTPPVSWEVRWFPVHLIQ